MEADNDDFLVIAPTIEDLDKLAKPLEQAWQITKQTLTPEESIEKNATNETGPPNSFQHVGLNIRRLPSGGKKNQQPENNYEITKGKRNGRKQLCKYTLRHQRRFITTSKNRED